MNYLEHIFQMWHALYDKNQGTEAIIKKFFHPDYSQCINGVFMNRHQYIEHVEAQKRNMDVPEFVYKNYLVQADELFLIYDVKSKNIYGEAIEAEVIAYFKFKDNKVLKIHGQVHLLKGDATDVDMEQV